MKLAEKSHQKIEDFFREHLADASFRLPEIYFYGGKFSHYLTRVLNIQGITIGRRIYIFPGKFRFGESRRRWLDEELVVHEITHVLQYHREGFFRFLWLYVKSYSANLRKKKKWDLNARSEAYFEIPFEIEARQAASKFKNWSKAQK